MKFRTEYVAEPGVVRLDVEKAVTLLGSCFSENIGRLMQESMWDARINPTGVLFNPISISNAVETAFLSECGRSGEPPFKIERFGNRWISVDFSYLSESTRKQAEAEAAHRLDILRQTLKESWTLIVTFGTAWVFEDNETGRVVANCHKLPSQRFFRRRLSVSEIVETWKRCVSCLRKVNPELKIIFSVSPVRHLADGFVGNSLSKATLRLAIEELVGVFDNCCYFPSFEILTDDLRDYRFYADDMLHPSSAGEEYIWEKFQQTFLDKKNIDILGEGAKLWRRLNHRSLYPDSEEYKKFQESTHRLLNEFLASHPGMKSPR